MDHLANLNDVQRIAVTYPSTGCLQILAGPGSGKTKTLTSRVAHLIKADRIQPRDIIVITFANKAANEMKHRLKLLLGENVVSDLIIGTFHAVCVRLLRRHGRLIGIKNNFVITDQNDSLSIIKSCLTANEAEFKALGVDIPKPGVVQDMISYAKAKTWSPDEYRLISEKKHQAGHLAVAVSYVYEEYQKRLKANNALDFDDLLSNGLELVKMNQQIIANVRHVLVDEFQDTNATQYLLIRQLAKQCKAITVVGDPDQSIYGWRSAEVENLEFMMDDFAGCKQIFLEENYRSTGAILAAAVAVVSQDKKRIDKTLYTSQPVGLPVVLRQAPSAPLECAYVAQEIKRMIAHSGGLLGFDDFAILLRYNALSRLFESTFQTESIPNKILGGTKFFDRVEVKDILSYLQLVENPSYGPAFDRAINVPKRGIGPSTIANIRKAAIDKGISIMDVVVKAINSGSTEDLKPAQKKALTPFVKIITRLRTSATKGAAVPDLIAEVVELIEYENYLERYHSVDKNARLENIEELKAFATQIAKNGNIDRASSVNDDTQQEEDVKPKIEDQEDVYSQEIDSDDLDAASKAPMKVEVVDSGEVMNPLQAFLAASMLSTDTVVEDEDNKQSKVTISTVHSAKGLEWPVVFVPCVEEGIFPFYRCKEEQQIEEERRLLYVAMTRAQIALYVTHSSARMRGSSIEPASLSKFITPVANPRLQHFANQADTINELHRAHMAQFLNRPPVDEDAVAQSIAAHTASMPASSQINYSQIVPSTNTSRFGNGISQSQQNKTSGNFGYRAYSSAQPLPRLNGATQPAMSGFKTASAAYSQSLSGQQAAASTSGFTTALQQHSSTTNISQAMQKAANETRLSTQNVASTSNGISRSTLASFQAKESDSLAALRSLGGDMDADYQPMPSPDQGKPKISPKKPPSKRKATAPESSKPAKKRK